MTSMVSIPCWMTERNVQFSGMALMTSVGCMTLWKDVPAIMGQTPYALMNLLKVVLDNTIEAAIGNPHGTANSSVIIILFEHLEQVELMYTGTHPYFMALIIWFEVMRGSRTMMALMHVLQFTMVIMLEVSLFILLSDSYPLHVVF